MSTKSDRKTLQSAKNVVLRQTRNLKVEGSILLWKDFTTLDSYTMLIEASTASTE